MGLAGDSATDEAVSPHGWPETEGPVSPTEHAIVRLRPLGLGEVKLADDGGLGGWQARNSQRTIPHCINELLATGALANLEGAGAEDQIPGSYRGLHFSDSDVYKVLEACAWDAPRGLSSEVSDFIEEATSLIVAAQREDGYINSYFQTQHPELVWRDLRWGHELYCVGHLIQASVAGMRTGWLKLAPVAERLVEHLYRTFSRVDGDGGLVGVCGHPEVETALVEYYRATGDERALEFAARQIEWRGQPGIELPASGVLGDRRFPLSYFLHHQPVRKRRRATGHAVRELYLQCGAVDLAVETNDQELLEASQAIWDDLYATKTYVTGAHGSRHRDESLGDAYELPSDRAYAETCAGVASFHWNWRLLLATGKAAYADAMERVLWNTIAGAVSKDGTEFFYSNTLHLRSDHVSDDEDAPTHRLPWYTCPCCPPNLARLLASIQSYLVTKDASGLQIHIPFSGRINTEVPGGRATLRIRTEYPWGPRTEIFVESSASTSEWDLSFFVGSWVGKAGIRALLNGQLIAEGSSGSYLRLGRRWTAGDRLELAADMPVRVLRPHWKIDALRGSAAIQRGPLVYCLEGADLSHETTIEEIAIDLSKPLEPTTDVPSGLEGYVEVALRGVGLKVQDASPEPYADSRRIEPGEEVSLVLVPYFARANRKSAPMRVWLPLSGDTDAG